MSLKFSSSHVKKLKATDEINFIASFNLAHPKYYHISRTSVILNINDLFYFSFFLTKASKSGVFYTHHTSQFRPALFQGLSSRAWLRVTASDHVGLKNEETKKLGPHGPRMRPHS